VVVTGTFRNTSGNNDYYTAKYAAADGALLWDKIYNGPANGEDIVRSPRSLALGPNGMVAVTGSSDGNFGGDTAYDYATVVYRENLPPAFVGFAASTLSVPEFEPEARVEVQRTGNLTTTVSVQYSAAPWGGAIIGQDYADVSGTLTFEPGETSDFIRVPILNDGEPEAMQGVQLTLSNPSGGAELGRTSAITYIIDNDRPTPAGPLIVTVGGPLYQDWSGPSLQWDQGYPGVNVRIDLDEATGGQIIADNEFVVGSHLNDQPAFTTTYTSNLRVNFLSAGFGQMKITYDLAFPIQLLDLMLLDVDEEDHVAIECRNRDGAPVDPRLLQLVMEGDLSRNFNAIGRPPSEAATPPVWNAAAGTLTAAVTWNENRSFTVLRPSVPVSSITLTFTGKRTGAHIYPLLWATPRRFEVTETRRTATGESHLRWTSLPGIPYRVMRSSNLADWVQVWAGDGAASPELTTQAIISSSELAPQFFRIQRW